MCAMYLSVCLACASVMTRERGQLGYVLRSRFRGIRVDGDVSDSLSASGSKFGRMLR